MTSRAALLVGIGVAAGLSAGCVPLPDPNVRYIAFGDSTTDGPTDADYPGFVRDLLGEDSAAFAIEARGGETAGDGVARLRDILDRGLYPNAHTLLYWQGATGLLRRAVQLDPLLLASPLDADYPFRESLTQLLDEIEADIRSAIEAGQGAGLRVLIATYFPPPDFITTCDALPTILYFPEQGRAASGYIHHLNERIRRAAVDTGATLVDVAALESEFRAGPHYYFDCNHLSGRGNARVAELFVEALLRALDECRSRECQSARSGLEQ